MRLEGAGFEVHAAEGATVAAGEPMVPGTVSVTRDEGHLARRTRRRDGPAQGSVPAPDGERTVAAGDLLYRVEM